MKTSLAGRAASEFLGTAFLLAAIIGSGIMAERLAAGNGALALLCNSLATGGALVALILTFRPFSGAHFNPVYLSPNFFFDPFPGRKRLSISPRRLPGARPAR